MTQIMCRNRFILFQVFSSLSVIFKTEESRTLTWHQSNNWFMTCPAWAENRDLNIIFKALITYSADKTFPTLLANQMQFEIALH